MLHLKKYSEITEAEKQLVANRMEGVALLNRFQELVLELSEYTTDSQFEEWFNDCGNDYIATAMKAVETFYINGTHPSLEAIKVTIATLLDFRGYAVDHLVKQEIA